MMMMMMMITIILKIAVLMPWDDRQSRALNIWGTKVCRYNWHSAGSLGWSFISNGKNKYIFQIKYTEAIFSNITGKLLWFEITKMLIVA